MVIAPHNDDEVLGVGGTIAKYASEGADVTVCEVTSSTDTGIQKVIRNEAEKAHRILGVKQTIFLDLPVVEIRRMSIKDKNAAFSETVQRVRPDIAFIPHAGDLHADHQETANAAMVALRPLESPQLKAVYAYETLSETEWNIPNAGNAFIPSVWSDITDFMDIKLKAMECYGSQLRLYPHPRSIEAIRALGKLRGSVAGVPYAESFISIRQLI